MTIRAIVRVGAACIVAVAAALASSAVRAESGSFGTILVDRGRVSAVADKDVKKPAKAVQKKETAKKPVAKGKKAKDEAPPAEHVELRSDTRKPDLFSSLFGGGPRMLPETQRRDALLKERDTKGRKFQVKDDFVPRVVDYQTSYARGTIVVDTGEKRLYLIESSSKARRYAIAVGRDGLKFKGKGKIKDKQEWPRWIPTQEMQKREPKKYGQYKDGMPGGPDNPLGARAMYLYQGNKDTHIRVHGTNQPWTVGTDSSNGCFRMINEHVMDLYNRVRVGADMVVL